MWTIDNPDFNDTDNSITFSELTQQKFEDWVLEFRSGGSKDPRNSDGFEIDNGLRVTQTNTRDSGGSRRTEAKVAKLKQGSYAVTMTLNIDEFPKGFDTSIVQVKCGGGKPPLIIKLRPKGYMRANSNGKSIVKTKEPVFKEGRNFIRFEIHYKTRGGIIQINDHLFEVNLECRCDKMRGGGAKDYYILKIGLYEDDIKPGYSILYKDLRVVNMDKMEIMPKEPSKPKPIVSFAGIVVLVNKVNPSDKLYLDRDYRFERIPEFLKEAQYIATCNDSKRLETRINLRAESDCTVYVAWDARSEPDKWLEHWTKRPEIIETEDYNRHIFAQHFKREDIITLKDNKAKSMYSVFIKPGHDESADKPDKPDWGLILSHEGRDARIESKEEHDQARKDGRIAVKNDGLHWYPRFMKRDKWKRWSGNPSSTVYRSIKPQRLKDGVKVLIRMKSTKEPELEKKGWVDYDYKYDYKEESSKNLHMIAGTGDFRIGLFQKDGDYKDWHGWQVRIHPHIHEAYKKHVGSNDLSNASHWYRRKSAKRDALLCDYMQDAGDHGGFKKIRHDGELKFKMGPNAPFDEFFDIELTLKEKDGYIYPTVRVHEDYIELDRYKHETDMRGEFELVDAVALSFNNMRSYAGLVIDVT